MNVELLINHYHHRATRLVLEAETFTDERILTAIAAGLQTGEPVRLDVSTPIERVGFHLKMLRHE